MLPYSLIELYNVDFHIS